jgi:hypothetical protein
LKDVEYIRKKYEEKVKRLGGDTKGNLNDLKMGITSKITAELYGD